MATGIPRSFRPAAGALALAVALLLAACGAPSGGGDGGSGSDSGNGGGDSGNGEAGSDGGGDALTAEEIAFSQGFCERLEAVDPTGEEMQDFDPDYFANWGIADLPGYGCHGPLGPTGGVISWLTQDTAFCDDATAHIRDQLESSGYTVTDQSGDLGSTIKLVGDSDQVSYVDWTCWIIDADDVAFFGPVGGQPLVEGELLANLSLSS